MVTRKVSFACISQQSGDNVNYCLQCSKFLPTGNLLLYIIAPTYCINIAIVTIMPDSQIIASKYYHPGSFKCVTKDWIRWIFVVTKSQALVGSWIVVYKV